jgi:ABC-2 type transport system ATP-binding protein
MSTPTVALRGVTRSFGRTQALSSLSVDLAPGVTGLLGPNGAGKSTLLRILATVLAHDDGTVRVLGLDPTSPDERTEIRRHLGYLPQEVGLHRSFSAFEFVDYVAILKEHTDKAARHAEVRRVLEVVGLADRAGTKIRKLSGGMRQRLALAQSLLGDPQLLLLDEPTVGLDPEQRLRFRELVSDLAATRTVVLSTHQTEDVAALCNQVIVLLDGTMAFHGTPADLAATAEGRVWCSDGPDATARLSWRTGDGRHRHIGDWPPPDADIVEPTIEEAYLLLAKHAVPTTEEVGA